MKNSMILDSSMPVVLGNCIRVNNVEKQLGTTNDGEDDLFICVQVESENGKDEYCILLTQREFDKLPRIEQAGMGDMVAGRIYRKFIEDTNYYLVLLRGYDGSQFVGKFEIGFWAKCFQRAIMHPKSCTRKGILTDMAD